MKEKHQGKTTMSATQIDTIATITERNSALIPFTIDQLGRLGCTAHEFLGMPETAFPPTKLPWNKTTDLSRTNEFAYEAHTFASNSPQHLLHGVNACGENYQPTRMETHITPQRHQHGSNKPQASTCQLPWHNT
jgi:hypothetical protein